jgi:hypothetical protein
MERKGILTATILGTVLVVTFVAGMLYASDTHLQVQNTAVSRNRPGIAERCVYFNPDTAQVDYFMDKASIELVVAPLRSLCAFANRDDAVRSLRVIRHYGINELCTTANSKLSYVLVSGKAPKGRAPGENYVTFDSYQLKVERVANDWKLVNGKSPVFSFGSDESAARQALQAIRHYGFNAKGSIGENRGFTYLCIVPTSPGIKTKPFLEAKTAGR